MFWRYVKKKMKMAAAANSMATVLVTNVPRAYASIPCEMI
jgi:hypothetical protein